MRRLRFASLRDGRWSIGLLLRRWRTPLLLRWWLTPLLLGSAPLLAWRWALLVLVWRVLLWGILRARVLRLSRRRIALCWLLAWVALAGLALLV